MVKTELNIVEANFTYKGAIPRRGGRMFVAGLDTATHIRPRFPLHPSLKAVGGVSIEGER